MTQPPLDAPETLTAKTGAVLSALEGVVLGQRPVAEQLLAGYMAGGHVLLQGVPGIGKTLLARSFATCLGLRFARVQFTPDLMPTDLTGSNVFDQAQTRFRLVRGPVFTQVLMADEINRTPPKTQSALLEAMQERQVTIDGVSHPLESGFFVIATQNPVEFEGTYPLPEAQLDRFLVRVEMGPPDEKAEREIYKQAAAGQLAGWTGESPLGPLMTPEEALALRSASRQVHVAPEVIDYLARLASAVRRSAHVELAISPRGALSLLEAARAMALLGGRDYVIPDDMKRLVAPCWSHRLVLSAESELEGHTSRGILEEATRAVEVPR